MQLRRLVNARLMRFPRKSLQFCAMTRAEMDVLLAPGRSIDDETASESLTSRHAESASHFLRIISAVARSFV